MRTKLNIYAASPKSLRDWLDFGSVDSLTFATSDDMETYGWSKLAEVEVEFHINPDDAMQKGVAACEAQIAEIQIAAGEKINAFENLRQSFLQIGYAGEASKATGSNASEETQQ